MTKKNQPTQYYEFSNDYTRGGPPGWELLNYDHLQADGGKLNAKVGWPDGYLVLPRFPYRVPDYVEPPRFVIDKKLGRPPRDIECIDGFFFVSAGMKQVFESLDPDACEFRRCETILKDGEPGPETWLCSIIRVFVGAVDVEASEYLIAYTSPSGGPTFAQNPKTKLHFKPDMIGQAHLFRIGEIGSTVFCDQALKEACKAAGVKGAYFPPCQ